MNKFKTLESAFLDQVNALNDGEIYQKCPNPYGVRFKFPPIPISFADFTGKYNISRLMIYLLKMTLYPLEVKHKDGSVFIDWLELNKKHLQFTTSVKYELSRKIHYGNSSGKILNVQRTLENIGRSSTTHKTAVFVPGCEEPLVVVYHHLVMVSKKTRKTAVFEKEWLDTFLPRSPQNGGLVIQPHRKPELTFCLTLQVLWSDTDHYNHTNFSSYPRWVLDAVHKYFLVEGFKIERTRNKNNSKEKELTKLKQKAEMSNPEVSKAAEVKPGTSDDPMKGLTKEMLEGGVKSLTAVYLQECIEGDILDIHIWRENSSNLEILARIEKNGVGLCTITFEYFPPLAKL